MLQLVNTAELVRQDTKLANATADQYGQASEARLQAGQCYSWSRTCVRSIHTLQNVSADACLT
jgi:hypothetical protein